ncbi:MAG: hypothetical protein PHY45_18590, partial [Rhodocyclaceae bacterium]|nr:hypothetical protein [Rhodocyclaceae bacterium]
MAEGLTIGAMPYLIRHDDARLKLALAASLLLHAAVLSWKPAAPAWRAREAAGGRLDVALAPAPQAAAPPQR